MMYFLLILIAVTLIALCVTICVVGTRIQIEIEMAGKSTVDAVVKVQLAALRMGGEARVSYTELAQSLRVIEEMAVEGHFTRAIKHSKAMSTIQRSAFQKRWTSTRLGNTLSVKRIGVD